MVMVTNISHDRSYSRVDKGTQVWWALLQFLYQELQWLQGYDGDYWSSPVLKVSAIHSSIGAVPQNFIKKGKKKETFVKGD